MSNKRTPIGSFIHSSWGNLNIRAFNGKYRHLATKGKNDCYDDILIEFTREEYKEWCLKNKNHILSLERPSLDRKNPDKNYAIENIQVIELFENLVKDKKIYNHKDGFGVCSICKIKKPSEEFAKDKRRKSGRGSICKKCDNARSKRSTGF